MNNKSNKKDQNSAEVKIIVPEISNEHSFLIKKSEKRVIIVMDMGKPKREECTLCLNLASRSGTGVETIKEYLENMDRFIPVKIGSSKKYSILSRESIIYVLEKEKADLYSFFQYDLLLTGNINIRVGQFMNMPQPDGRLLDFLLKEENFVPFLFRGSKIHVNRNKIIKGYDNE
ncbi:MAG: hypothetical protein KAS97_00400 [Candidatus Aminicenantes bacterium]|nr:hypothetical protein [Candidatus Aminicenantes bacterium]